MMRRASKQRYEMAGGRIRALYGHSLPGKLKRTQRCRRPSCFAGGAPARTPVQARVKCVGLYCAIVTEPHPAPRPANRRRGWIKPLTGPPKGKATLVQRRRDISSTSTDILVKRLIVSLTSMCALSHI